MSELETQSHPERLFLCSTELYPTSDATLDNEGALQVKSSQVYFFNSRIKYTAKLHNTKLYSEIYTVTHNKIIQ